MLKNNVDLYFIDGCGRCPLGGTPNCKVNNWPKELLALRQIALECGLNEELKWGVPVYTYQKANIVIVAAFKEYCSLSFFKGALLADSEKLLSMSGENSQSARLFKFTDIATIKKLESSIKTYIYEAIEIEKAGIKVAVKKTSDLILPVELINKFNTDPAYKIAFDTLTASKQKGYIYYFSQAKQAKTRENRIEASKEKILSGKGIFDY